MDTRTLCLGVLSRGPASGYEIKKAFEEGPFSHIHATSFGSVYPALNKLSAEGQVTCREQSQDGRPDKKVYAVTPAGREAFEAELMKTPGPDKVRSDFLFILSFAEFLPAKLLGRLIDARIAWYDETLARMSDCGQCATGPGARFVHGMGVTIYSAARDYLKAHRDELLAEVSGSHEQAAE